MINSVNNIGYVSPLKQNFKANDKTVDYTQTVIHREYSSNVNDVLASYAKGSLNLNKLLDIKPLKPLLDLSKDFDSIDGERIYSSDGSLHSIVKDNGKTKIIYEADQNNEKMVSLVSVESKETGKILLTQHNEIEDGEYKGAFIAAFNPRTGKEEAYTSYVDGKLSDAGKYVRDFRGAETSVTKYYDDNSYVVDSRKNSAVSSFMHISGDRKEVRYSERIETKNGEREVSVTYYNGAPISVNERVEKTLPNLLILEALQDEDLIAAPPMNIKALEKALVKIDGEETHYSNGALETKTVENNGVRSVLKYSPDSKLNSIESDFAKVELVGNSSYKFTEKLEDGVTRETFRSDSMTRIFYNDNNKAKEICYDRKTGIPMSYQESEIIDGEEKNIKVYYFDKTGMVNRVYNN